MLVEATLVLRNIRLLERALAGTPDEVTPLPPSWRQTWLAGWVVWASATPLLLLRCGEGRMLDPVFVADSRSVLAVLFLGGLFAVPWWRLVTWGLRHQQLRWRVSRSAAATPPRLWTAFPMVAPAITAAGVGLGLLATGESASDGALRQVLLEGGASGDDAVELLVELGPDDSIFELLGVMLEHGAVPVPALGAPSARTDEDLAATWVVRVPKHRVEALSAALRADAENVDLIELNTTVAAHPATASGRCFPGRASVGVDDPLSTGQFDLVRLEVDTLLRHLRFHRSVRPVGVALLDTGVYAGHDDLVGSVRPSRQLDRSGHGTAMAGLIAASAHNGRGIASPNLGGKAMLLHSYPTLATPGAAADDVADDLERAVAAGARVVSLSFGGQGTAPKVVQRAVARALARDVVVIAAAGNGGPTGRATDQWPANLPGVLVVGATDRSGAPSATSSRVGRNQLAVSAPGEQVCSLTASGGYGVFDGTSVATARVAGVAGALRALCPEAKGTLIVQALVQTAARPADGAERLAHLRGPGGLTRGPHAGPEVRAATAHAALREAGHCP